MTDEKIFIKRSEVKRFASIFKVSEVMIYMSSDTTEIANWHEKSATPH